MGKRNVLRNALNVVCKGLQACVLLCFIVGCGDGPEWLRDDPELVLKTYLSAVEGGATKTMWNYYTVSTREALEKRALAYRQAHPEVAFREAYDMILTGHVLSTTREYKRIELLEQDAQRAVVNIILHDTSVIAVHLVRESDRWAIALPL